MKVVLATGVPQLDAAIESKMQNVTFVGAALYKEAVVDVVRRRAPDVIVLSELLEGVTPMRELILTLRTRFPKVRIIYVLKEDNPAEKKFLYHWLVFDVFVGSFTVAQLTHSLAHPKEFVDVSSELDELQPFEDQDFPADEDEGLSEEHTKIDSSVYTPIVGPTSGTNTLYLQVAAFWSVVDQTGKTFSITNTALALGGRSDLKILLLDFNLDNPNVNLYYSFADPNKNLGAIFEDVEAGETIHKDNLDKYLITHPAYHNLKILPGMILKMKKPPADTAISVLESILHAAEQRGFSTILIDTKAGLDPLSVHILKRASKILLHITESPGSLNALYRCFDTEVGPFVEQLIDRKRLIPVINESHPETRLVFSKAIHAFFEKKPGATIPFSPDVRPSVFKGIPLLSKKYSDEMYRVFLRISNLIHHNVFDSSGGKARPAKRPKAPPASGGKGVLGKWFPKKK